VSGAPGRALANWPLSGIRRRRMAIIHRTVRWCTGLSGEPTAASATVGCQIRRRCVARSNGRQGAPDCPVCTGQCSVSQRPLEQRSAAQSAHDTWPMPTVGWVHRTVRCAPDCPVCTGQCPVRQPARRSNSRLRQEWKEIRTGHATVAIRWCTGLSGAPPDRRQELPSLLGSNGS
jgi:hypothetical protein